MTSLYFARFRLGSSLNFASLSAFRLVKKPGKSSEADLWQVYALSYSFVYISHSSLCCPVTYKYFRTAKPPIRTRYVTVLESSSAQFYASRRGVIDKLKCFNFHNSYMVFGSLVRTIAIV
jgi:hypothetical protein